MHRIIQRAKKEKRSLLETEAKELLREYKIPVPAFKLIKNEEEISKIREAIGYPIVMKIVSPDIIHKSDAGGVKVGIGIIKDPHFGPVAMFGLGGIFVEVLKDVSFRIIPLEERDAREMITEIKGYKILKGARGEFPKDIKAIREVLMKVSKLTMENPEISEIDLNPIFVFENGIQVVDARMIL
jgi:acyl-CoA synthetase (NDP forming)